MSIKGLHQVTFALRQHGEDMESEISAELDALAQMAARRMRELAGKFRSTMAQSIHVSSPDKLTREVRPGVDYAEQQERGIKPGGKGLPRFFDPASASIVAWLQSQAFGGQPRVRKGTGKFTARELMLRDRYEGLAWHIRHKGTKARPFVEPTAKEMESITLNKLDLAVRRVLARRPAGGGAEA